MFTWCARHPRIVLSAVVMVVLPVFVWSVVRFFAPDVLKPTPPAQMAYFYDLETSQLVVREADFPPVIVESETGPPQHELVWAYVYGCGDCADAEAHHIGYLQTVSSEGKTAAVAMGLEPMGEEKALDEALANEGYKRMVSRPGPITRWFAADSPEGVRIVSEAGRDCPQERPATRCTPP
jgi:hypothetical protein